MVFRRQQKNRTYKDLQGVLMRINNKTGTITMKTNEFNKILNRLEDAEDKLSVYESEGDTITLEELKRKTSSI